MEGAAGRLADSSYQQERALVEENLGERPQEVKHQAKSLRRVERVLRARLAYTVEGSIPGSTTNGSGVATSRLGEQACLAVEHTLIDT